MFFCKKNKAVTPSCSGSAASRGDPHFKSIDGLTFDMHTPGAYTFCRSSNVHIETCQLSSSKRSRVSVNKAVAVRLSSVDTLMFMRNEHSRAYELYLNGVLLSVQTGTSSLLVNSGATVFVKDWTFSRSAIVITMPLLPEDSTADKVYIDAYGGFYMNVRYSASAGNYLQTNGLCGMWDCVSSNDNYSPINTWASSFRQTQASTSLFAGLPIDCLFTSNKIDLPVAVTPTPEEETAAATCCGAMFSVNDILYQECVTDMLSQGGVCSGPLPEQYLDYTNTTSPACANPTCAGHGTCVAGQCICDDGYSGSGCTIAPGIYSIYLFIQYIYLIC